jgi:hypothetical protein
LMSDDAAIVELDINPLCAYEQDVVVLDASMVTCGSPVSIE